MKTEQELQKYIRDEISNPVMQEIVLDMVDEGTPYKNIIEIVKILVEHH
jgi:hypothetical protein